MIVDLFTIEPDGAEHIWCCAVDLYECFPDDMETALVVEAELIERGFTYTGGGAAQRFKVVRCGHEDSFDRKLCAEYQAWCDAQRLPQMSAEELLHEDLTPDQRQYVSGFINRWEAMLEAQDQ